MITYRLLRKQNDSEENIDTSTDERQNPRSNKQEPDLASHSFGIYIVVNYVSNFSDMKSSGKHFTKRHIASARERRKYFICKICDIYVIDLHISYR